MICEIVQMQLTALADGELAPETAAEIQRHLEACQACTGVYSESLQVREMAGAWRVDTPDVSARISSAIAADEQRLLLAEMQGLRREMEGLRDEVSVLRRQLASIRPQMPLWSPPRRVHHPKMENDPWNLVRS